MKGFLVLAALCPAAFGFEISRDTLESKFVGGDSVWLINRSPQTARIPSVYVKLLSGRIGNDLVFDVSNEPQDRMMGSSHYYNLQAVGDSLFEAPGIPNPNRAIVIPPRDSVSIKNVLYGTCIYCVSSSAPFNYTVELNFVESGRPPVKLIVVGNFVSGAVRSGSAPPHPSPSAGRPFRIDGRQLPPESGSTAARRKAPRISPSARPR